MLIIEIVQYNAFGICNNKKFLKVSTPISTIYIKNFARKRHYYFSFHTRFKKLLKAQQWPGAKRRHNFQLLSPKGVNFLE